MTSSCGVNSFQSDWSINAEFSSTCIITTIGNSLDGVDILHLSRFHFASIMMTSSKGNISASLAICAGNSPVPGEFPTQRPVTRSFDVYFDLRPNKRLSKQSWGWWFETLSCSLWRHRNELSFITRIVAIYLRELVGHFWWRHLVNRNYTKSLIAKLTWKMAFQYN